ncbi:MAG TPA: TPM domain-containing protein [Syntrophorhabdaceae bacterium]|nr:TPM domain-containing protein [Syntrophorhabdaceae bacterium]
MRQILSEQDRTGLDERVAEAEKCTGTQVVLAVIERSDSYAEVPWKAFAMGASIAGLLVFVFGLAPGSSSSNMTALVAVVATLAAGCALALLTIFVPALAGLFLSAHRVETEVRQYAQSVFLTREIFATRARTGVLLLVSLFERRVVLLPDSGLQDRLTGDAIRDIIARMTPSLAQGEIARALEEGLEKLSEILSAVVPAGQGGGNELPDGIIEEEGV